MTATITTHPTTISTTSTSTTSTTRGRVANGALWTLQVLTAAVFVVGALPKLTADPLAVAGFEALGFGQVGMYVIGALELAGAVALLIPRLCGLAGLAFVALMIGAVITTVVALGPAMIAMPAGVLVLVAVIAWGRRRRTAELVAWVRGRVRG